MIAVQKAEPKKRKVKTGYRSSSIYGWQSQNQSALDLLNEYYNRINAGEWLSNEDRAKYKSAIDTYTTTGNALRDVSKFYGTKYTDAEEKSWQDSLSSLNQGYTSVNDFYGQFADENQYNLWSRWEKPVDDVDYEKYVQTGKGSANPSWEDTRKKLFGESANVNNMVTFAENNAENAFGDALQGLRAGASGYTHTNLVNLINLYMTDEEKSRYNYYIGKGDTATAQEYLSYIENELNKRLGGEISKQVDSTVLEPFFAFESGMQSGIYGIENAVRGVLGKEGVTTSPLQYANSYSNENNKGAWKVINDLANTTGNMAPSLVIGAINPTAGAVTMGVSAGGNAYSEMLQQGYSVNQARAYGVMTGASEAVLSKLLGGISKLGGNSKGVFQSLSSKVLPGVNNAIGRVAIQIGGNMADEALEEGVQTLLDPVFKWAATLGEAELEKVNWEEVGYSALLGGLSAGLLEGTPTISNAVSTNLRTQKAFGSQAQNIVADALEINPNDKMAIKAQTAINKGKQVSGLTLDALLNKTDTTKVKQAVSDRLTELGERGNVAKISDAIAREQAGEELSLGEKNLIKKSDFGKSVRAELNPETLKSDTEMNRWAESIGTRRLNSDVYSKRPPSVKVQTNEGKSSEIGSIKAVEGDVATVELSDGTVAKVGLGKNTQSEVKFNDAKTEEMFKIATERVGKVEGWTVESANAMVTAFEHSSNGLGVSDFTRAWSEAYNIGRNNNSRAQLNHSSYATLLDEATRSNAYNIGKAIAIAPKTITSNATYSVTFDEGIDPSTFNKKQKNDIKALEIVSKALGLNVKVFDSPVNAKGERIGKNGSYNPTTRTLEVDLHAGNHGEGIINLTSAHEVTHHMKVVARDQFNNYADAVFETLGEDGKVLIANKLEQLSRNGHLEGMTEEEAYDLAFEEVVADSSERMFVDTDALVKLSETLKKKDKTLWEKFRDGVVNILNKLKKAYAELNPQSEAAQALMNAQDKLEKIQKLWVEGVVAAAEVSDQVSTEKSETKNQDRAYLEAVEQGDMETAQRMVDEAAKNWGAISLKGNKPTTFYHGTNENFTEFRPEEMSSVEGSYFFAENREDASAYGDNIYEVYLSGKKLADYDNQPSEFYRLRNKRNQVAWLKERGYDGWYADMDSGGWGEISVFSPNQVKSTAPVTYDDDGNVIPLSERFKPENNDIRYSFRNSSSGMANDGLSPYNAELTKFIEQNNGYIVDSFDKLKKVVNLAFDNPNAKGTAYFGIINTDVLEKIKNSIPNLPQATRDVLFKKGKDYSIATTLDSIRHIVDEKKLSRTDVIDYLDRLADTIVEFDSVAFNYYNKGNNKLSGLLFKKRFDDGTLVSFDIVSHKKRSIVLQTLYMDSADYQKKKAAETLLMQNAHSNTSKTQVGQPSTNSISQKNDLSTGNEKNLNQDRLSDEESFSNRSILANALASTATNSEETELLEEYKKEIAKLDENDKKIAQYKSDLKALYEKGQPNFTVIKELSGKIKKLEGQNYYHDKKLLKLESTTALKNVLKRARKDSYAKAMQKGKELMHKNVEGRYKTIERNKIKKIAHELDTLLNKGNKKRNVKIGAQGVVRAALDLSDMYFTSDDELVMNGIKTEATDKEASAMEQYKELYEKLHATDDDVTNHKEERAEIRHEMNELKKDFAELLERERKRINNTKAKTVYNTLIEEYEKLANSPSRHIAQAFDADTLNHIKTLRDNVGENLVREMTLEQIKDVYKAFKMVKTMVTNSNKLFNENLKESVDALGNEALHEIEKHGHKEKFTKVGKTASEFSWNNLKPVYLMERTGSHILQKLFQKVLDGESVWAKDMLDAREYIEKQKNEYKYDNWDFKKTYEFSTPSGKTFKLNLEQIMTIYAYSNRGKQAIEHLSTDGFVFDKVVVKEKGVEYELNDKTAYKITDEVRIKMTGLLTQDQKDYVDAMQKYLSKTMGAKGNEVSKAMYGIELYGEENYLPIHSEGAYLERAREQAKGDVKLKNKGFTKSTVKHARNAIVLSEFDKLCTEHIAEMSSYHAFTLPLEDFYKVYNYQVDSDDVADKRGVIPALENAYGKGATGAIDQLLTDLNGGARGDSRETIAKNLIALYKKAKVMLSLSVVIQQPSSIIRAQAMIDPKYFVGQKIGDAKRKELWAEMKKYAPVTIIKEMGYFDVGMGKASADWLLDDPTLSEKIDELASKPAAKADELTWIAIWNAVKRETASKNTSLNTSSVEFLEKAGERFEDVIRHTQVYDSTLARSGNMRSKSALMQMATSFMAEPTTSLNMREAALRSKDARRIARTTAAIYGATLLNAVLVAIPYAMRDDDEDETFLEKYITALSTSFVDNLNPINSIPFAKDIWSLMQGYNVDRADMSAASALIDSFNKLVKMATKEDREQGDIENAILNLIGDLSSFSGLPIDNVRRDAMSAFNTYKTLTRGYDTTWKSIEDVLQRDFQKSTPVWNLFRTESKNEKLYEAVLAKDDKYVERFKSTYKDEDAYYSALRKAIRENDPRVEQAAKARLEGDNDTYYNLMYDVIGEGNFDSKLIKDAFKAEYEYLKDKKKEAEAKK